MESRTTFDDEAVRAFDPDAKVGLLATVSEEGLPHLTLITSIRAKGPARLTWGQFCEGKSKTHVRANPKVAFLVMTLARELWTGRGVWTGDAREGPDFEAYNKTPMFRYNSYFGIHTVHYADLAGVSAKGALRVPAMVAGQTLARGAALLAREGGGQPRLSPWSASLIGRIDSLKFLSWVGGDGFPRIFPAVPCAASRGRGLLLVPAGRGGGAQDDPLAPGGRVALYALSLEMENVLVRGVVRTRVGPPGARFAVVEIDWVYNSMPPQPGQVWPPLPLSPVRFAGQGQGCE